MENWGNGENKDRRFSNSSILQFLFMIAILFGSSAAHASPESDLDQTQEAMHQSQVAQAKLVEQKTALEKELKTLQKQLVDLAVKIRKSEVEVADAEDKLRVLDAQMQVKDEALKARKKELAAMVQAVLHLGTVPPEAMVMMPGDVMQIMTAAQVLKMTSASIKQDMESIGQQMAELQELKAKVEKNREVLQKQQAVLKTSRGTMEAKLSERNAMRDRLDQQERQETARLKQLAKKAAGLQDLMASLEQEEKENREARQHHPEAYAQQGAKGRMRSFASARGHIRLPVAGRMVQSFGMQRNANETSKGIVIATRGRAQVIAPYDGEVVYSGIFLHYGQMVILRHGDGFHTLLSGFAKIDVTAGQFLLEGEPIGAMGENDPEKLYIELRKNNQPVDPAEWMKVQ